MRNESLSPERMAGRSVIALAILLSLSVHLAVMTAWYHFTRSHQAEDSGDPTPQASVHLSFAVTAPETIALSEPAREAPPSPAPDRATETPAEPAQIVEPPPQRQDNVLPQDTIPESPDSIVTTLASSSDSVTTIQSSVEAQTPDEPTESEQPKDPQSPPVAVQTRPMLEEEVEALQPVLAQLQSLNAQQLEQAFNSNAALMIAEHRIEVTEWIPADLTSLASYEIAIRYEENGQQLSTTATLNERAFSHYAKFVHRWDPLVSMSEDRIEGHFHSNSAVNLFADHRSRPDFDGPVTIAATQHISRRTRRSGLFPAGVETGVDAVPLPTTAMPAPFLLNPSAIELHTFDHDTRITFLADGRYQWQHLDNPDKSGMKSTNDQPVLVAATGNARLEVSGDVNGVIALFSPHRITINGNLVYAENQAEHSQLTLISDGIVEIASRSVTGGGDLHIHAAIYARQRFSVRRFRDRHQGELYIYGSLIAGSLSATEPRFTTHIRHDPRFENNRAPAFPGTGQLQLASWDQQWSIEPLTGLSRPDAPDIYPPSADE